MMEGTSYLEIKARSPEAADATFQGVLGRPNEKHLRFIFIRIVGPETDCRVAVCLN